jgi:hypothetical protein
MTLRLIILVWVALAAMVLTAGVVRGQDLLPENEPPTFMPPPFAAPPPGAFDQPPVFAPSGPMQFEGGPPVFTPPTSTPFEPPAAEIRPEGPPKDDRRAGGLDDFGMGGRGMGGMGMGAGGPGYGATWYPTRPVSGSGPGEELGLVRENLSGAFPVWRNGGDVLMLSAGVRNDLFSTDVILPDSHRPFPNELWNVNFGTTFLHKFDNGWSGGAGIMFGSASDKPFYSISEMTLGFISFLQVPVCNDRDSWRFALMYSPVGNLNFPIPGVAYVWNPSDALRVSVGLPLSVTWRPIADLTVNMSYMPLTTVNARATYRVYGKVFVFGGFEWCQEAYLLADRENLSDRFLGYEKRLIGGVRCDVWQHTTLEMNAGYVFDRIYGIGQNQITNLHDQVDIAPGAFLGTNLRIRF